MSRGRGLAQLIIHMSHLTTVGWGYFGCSILLSGIFYSSSKKIIPHVIKEQARKSYPEFEWIVVPQYSISLSLLIFIIMNSFLGYFCHSDDSDDDIEFFIILGIVFFLFMLLPILIQTLRLRCVMRNNGGLFISRCSLFGLYKRISINRNSVTILPDEKKQISDAYIVFNYDGNKRCKLDKLLYSDNAWNILKHELTPNLP